MVSKAGLYQRGLLKSLMTWAIPFPIAEYSLKASLPYFVSPAWILPSFVPRANTCPNLDAACTLTICAYVFATNPYH